MRILSAAILLGLVPCAAPAEDRALLIGIGAYAAQQRLDGPPNDLATMQALATGKMGFAAGNVLVLSDTEATRSGVLSAFRSWLVDGTAPGDKVLVYFSGHGTQIADRNGDEIDDGMDEALVMVGYGPDAPEELVSDDDIRAVLDQLADRNVTLVIDACHSGTISRAGVSSEPVPKPRFVPPLDGQSRSASRDAAGDGRQRLEDSGVHETGTAARNHEVWTAAAAEQVAYETSFGGVPHGVFTKAFHDAISGQSDSGSREQVLAMVRESSDEFCAGWDGCSSLTPELTAPPLTRALAIVDWPEDTGETGRPPLAAETMLGSLAGGRADVSLAMVPYETGVSGPVHAGQTVAFEVTSTREGELLLFDLRDGGLVHQLYPSDAIAKRTPLAAGELMRLPDAYHKARFRIPAGQGILVALVVNDRGVVDRLSEQNRDMRPIADPMAFFGDLMAQVNGVWHGDSENRKISFGMAALPYDVN